MQCMYIESKKKYLLTDENSSQPRTPEIYFNTICAQNIHLHVFKNPLKTSFFY